MSYLTINLKKYSLNFYFSIAKIIFVCDYNIFFKFLNEFLYNHYLFIIAKSGYLEKNSIINIMRVANSSLSSETSRSGCICGDG